MENSSIQYNIFLTIVESVGISQNIDLIYPYFKNIEKYIGEWNISEKQIRNLYKIIRDSLKNCGKK